MCTVRADSGCGAAETNTALQSNCPPLKHELKGLPSSPVVENLPSSAGDAGSIPGQGTKTLQATGLARHNRS